MDKYEQTVKLWKEWNVRTVADLDLRLDSFRILFAFNSGKIENPEITYHDTREIFENGKIAGYTGNPRTLFEQQNQKTCYAFLCEKIVGREKPFNLLRKFTGCSLKEHMMRNDIS